MIFDPKVVAESGTGNSQPLASWGAAAALTIAVAIAYFFAARLGLALLTEPDGVAVFWPAAGISSGMLIALGSKARLPVVAGVATATIFANVLGDRNLWSALIFATCNAGEAVIAAGLIHRFFGCPFALDRLHRVLGLMAAAIVATAISGIGGAAGFKLFHASPASAPTIWLHWFAADAIGIVTVAPLIIGLFSAWRDPPPPRERLEGALALVAITLLSGLATSMPHEMWVVEIALVLFVPLLVWIGARCSPIFSAIGAFIVAFAIVSATTLGIGMFGIVDIAPAERALAAQSAIVAVAFCALVLGALFAERRQHIHALVERQQQMESALDAAERADRAKSIFLAAASHDLRQPLQTLNLLRATLSRQAADAETRALAAEIGDAVDVMNGMLISLLDINRLESGTLSPSMTDFPINELFDSALRDFRQPIADKGLDLRVVRSRMFVRSDRRILEEMIRNILSNAVRYTDRGRILVGCRRAGDKSRIEIWDTGVGIMGEHLPRIFEEYYQAPGAAQYGGFGLGLAIVQRLGTVLGHRIDVRSVPGKGSGFIVQVPIGTPAAAAQPASDVSYGSVSLAGSILVIEDDRAVRSALDDLLSSAGAQVVTVATAHDALCQIAEEGVRPDVIVSDYNLPGKMNGAEAVRALRKALGREVPAIVLTGDIREEVNKELVRHEIVIAFKPIDADRFLRLLEDFIMPNYREGKAAPVSKHEV